MFPNRNYTYHLDMTEVDKWMDMYVCFLFSTVSVGFFYCVIRQMTVLHGKQDL